MKRVTFLFLVLTAVLACGSAAAATLTVYSASSAWQSVSSTAGATFVLPAVIPGCGQENEPSCEPTGIFYFNQTWAGIPSYIQFNEDPTGGLSDIITFDSLGPNGMFRVMFFSDPSVDPSDYAGYYNYATYTEDPSTGYVTGAIPVCCITQPPYALSVVLASDGEAPFDPFGYGADTSDGIQFQGAVNGGTIPEPATLSLVLMGAGALICLRKRMVR